MCWGDFARPISDVEIRQQSTFLQVRERALRATLSQVRKVERKDLPHVQGHADYPVCRLPSPSSKSRGWQQQPVSIHMSQLLCLSQVQTALSFGLPMLE